MDIKEFNKQFPGAIDDPKFRDWLEKVDAIIQRETGLNIEDLFPDYRYRDEFDNGASPFHAAIDSIRYAKDD